MERSLSTGLFLVALLFMQLCLGCIEEERQALLKLKRSFKDPGNLLASWNGTKCCNWEGVECDDESGHVVTRLSLGLYSKYDSSPRLSASEVSPSLADLKHLHYLFLGSCDFQGSHIPEFLGSFEYLTVLYLYDSGFRGPIPESLGNLTSLETLDVSGNKLTGFIPESLARLSTNFSYLDVADNQLEGPIPESLGRLAGLTKLDLSGNLLNGSIPSSLGNFSNLDWLSLSNNKLSKEIPKSLWQLSKLDILDLSSNSLEGTITELHFANLSSLGQLLIGSNNLRIRFKSDWSPSFNLSTIDMSFCFLGSEFPRWLYNQTELRYLDLSNTNISGRFPTWLPHMPHLHHFDLSGNQIQGSLSAAEKMPELQILRLRNNALSGAIPESFCEFSRIMVLDLSRNNLSGELPDCWHDTFNLFTILLSSNKFSGRFPASISNCSYLRHIHLSDNNLSGEFPPSLENSTGLAILDLGKNKFSGPIPGWIGTSLLSLRVLRLRDNLFNKGIPSEICQRTELQILDLAMNNLSGEIPHCFNNITQMTREFTEKPFSVKADEKENRYGLPDWREKIILMNEIHNLEREEITEMIKGIELEYTTTLKLLNSIDLSRNKLYGPIPDELCKLARLRSLNLSHNRLSGNIPRGIGGLESIESLDLSHNRLFGEIPKGLSTLKFVNFLNLSHNDFSGRIPESNQLQTLTDPSIYAGNYKLCGDFLPKKCRDSAQPPISRGHGNGDKAEEKKMENIWFWLVVMIGYALGLWGVIGALVFKKNWRIAYFRFVDNKKEWILAMFEIKVARLKQRIQRT